LLGCLDKPRGAEKNTGTGKRKGISNPQKYKVRKGLGTQKIYRGQWGPVMSREKKGWDKLGGEPKGEQEKTLRQTKHSSRSLATVKELGGPDWTWNMVKGKTKKP